MNKKSWFEVDKKGLEKIVARRDKSFIIYELLQNAWDENGVTEVLCNLKMIPNKQLCEIKVIDDSPNGFCNLKHAFVLFAESYKKEKPNKRGRFDIGEKLVLSQCQEASIISTTGGVKFLSNGERILTKEKRKKGSSFEALIKMTKKDYNKICNDVKFLIPPKNIKTYFNNSLLMSPPIAKSFKTKLPTEISDKEGRLKKTIRKTSIEIYYSKNKEGWIYEMGIPVVKTGDKFNINVLQKVPLNMDRDNVTPSYLRTLRTVVLNNTIDLVEEEEASDTWVKEALSDKRCNEKVVIKALDKKFGKKRVIFDPSDPEANKIAVSKGYTVIPGKSLSKDEWSNVKKSNAALPAGQVTPSNKITTSPDGIPPLDWKDLTEKQKIVLRFSEAFAKKIMDIEIKCQIIKIPRKERAWYGQKCLTFNLSRLGSSFFERFPRNLTDVVDLLLHEFAHQYSSDHLSSEYYRALSKLGAKSTKLALDEPSFFKEVIINQYIPRCRI